MTVVEAALLSPLFLPVDVAEMSWTVHVENGVFKKVEELVGSAPASGPAGAQVPAI